MFWLSNEKIMHKCKNQLKKYMSYKLGTYSAGSMPAFSYSTGFPLNPGSNRYIF